MKRKNGRPSKYSEELAERILEAVRAGAIRAAAAEYAQVGERTLYDWMRRFPQFAQAIKKADADCEIAFVGVILNAARGTPARYDERNNLLQAEREPDWHAAAWWLERRHPETWRRRGDVVVVDGRPVDQDEDPAERNRRILEVYGIAPLASGWPNCRPN
jgi:transposase